MNHLGITGPKKGMTEKQYRSLQALMRLWKTITVNPIFHHGDCTGVDFEACILAWKYEYDKIVCHPPINNKDRSNSTDIVVQEVREPKEYLTRNDDIVIESHVLIGVSETFFETLRSGTWATIRHAKNLRKLVIIIWPDGSIEIPEK
jgi:hypothetical protein